MNPFDLAQSLGYGKDDLLKFLGKANPTMKNALTKAVGAGYSVDQTFQFLSKAMAGAKVDPKMSRRVFGDVNAASVMRQAENVPQRQSAGHLPILGGLGGAAIGAAVGGPIGAVVGGAAGYNQLDKLTKAYEGHIQGGGRIPFGSFVTELAKGAAVAGLSAAQVGPLREAASQYLQSQGEGEEKQEGGGEAPIAPQEGQAPAEAVQAEEIITPEADTGEKSYEYFKDRGMGRIIDSFADQITPEQGRRGLRKMYGAESVRDIERENKKPITQMLEEAFNFSKSQRASGPEERAPVVEERASGPEEGAPVVEEGVAAPGEGTSVMEESASITDERAPVVEERASTQDEPYDTHQKQALDKLFQSSVPTTTKDGKIERGVRPIPSMNISSSILGTFYDKDTKIMKSLFKSGEVYNYDNVTFEDFQNVVGGNAQPLTEGQNIYGAWNQSKKKSQGAAQDKYIKKNLAKYPHTKLVPSEYTDMDKQLVAAKNSYDAGEFFAPFKEKRTHTRRGAKAEELKEKEIILQDMTEELRIGIIADIEEGLKGVLKHPPTTKRLQKELKKKRDLVERELTSKLKKPPTTKQIQEEFRKRYS